MIIILATALLATLLALICGLVTMVVGGQISHRYGNLLMRLRVGLQGAAILLLVIALLFT